jgi:hypothetical protein
MVRGALTDAFVTHASGDMPVVCKTPCLEAGGDDSVDVTAGELLYVACDPGAATMVAEDAAVGAGTAGPKTDGEGTCAGITVTTFSWPVLGTVGLSTFTFSFEAALAAGTVDPAFGVPTDVDVAPTGGAACALLFPTATTSFTAACTAELTSKASFFGASLFIMFIQV